MSGVIPDSIITVSTPITQSGWPTPYRIISFPSRVTVTGVSFTVDATSIGDPEDARVFYCAMVKGRRTKDTEAPAWYEDIVPFFGDTQKPTIVCVDDKFRSTVVAPADRLEWYTVGPSYTADVAQMDTDEYLTVWVSPDDGNFPEEFDWAATTATISIAYTGATNLD